MGNPFVHVELNTTDVAKAKTFYGQLFDWKMEDVPMGPGYDYTTISPGEGTGGGITNKAPGADPSAWIAYVLVDDVAATVKKAKSLGASIKKDTTEIPDIGTFAIITDPTGAALAFWKPKPKAS